jgi:hypothetical protein
MLMCMSTTAQNHLQSIPAVNIPYPSGTPTVLAVITLTKRFETESLRVALKHTGVSFNGSARLTLQRQAAGRTYSTPMQ